MYEFLLSSFVTILAQTALPGEEALAHEDFAKELFNMLFTLGLLIFVIVLFAWIARRFLKTRVQCGNTTNAIKVIDRRMLGPKSAVYLLRIKNRCVLVADSPSGLRRLSEIDVDPDDDLLPPTPLDTGKKSFREIFMRKGPSKNG